MRRMSAITLIAVSLCSASLPLWAASAAMASGAPMMCHREAHKALPAHHHCDEMQTEDGDAQPESSISVSRLAHQCPMNCCTQANLSGGAAVAVIHILPPRMVTEKGIHFSAPVFSRNGFSSHTDRGPPAV